MNLTELIDITEYSSVKRLFRVTAIVLKFCERLKGKTLNAKISAADVESAQTLWLKCVQHVEKDVVGSKFQQTVANLKLFTDEHGVLRCKGRLDRSDLEYERKYPVFLPKNSHLTTLLIEQAHRDVKHMGPNDTLVQMRSRFWIVQGRRLVKSVVSRCTRCRRVEGRSYPSPPTASLPEFRVMGDTAFTNIGIDYCGPLYVYDIYKRTTMFKSYILLATCALSRAVHLELVPNQSSTALIRALKRVFARRGTASMICSDNGKSFKSELTVEFARELLIRWRYNLELAPWWGGFFERLVRMTKRVLRKVLEKSRLTFEELTTVVTEVEGVVNNRPLTYVPDEISEPLTPSHLLQGRRLMDRSPVVSTYSSELNETEMTKRAKHLDKVVRHCWTRWRHEYLTELRERDRHVAATDKSPSVGDVVLISEKLLPRGRWRIGRVDDLIKGKDGVVRGARVVLSNRAVLNRPVENLYPVEMSGTADVSSVHEPTIAEESLPRPKRQAAVTGECIRRLATNKCLTERSVKGGEDV